MSENISPLNPIKNAAERFCFVPGCSSNSNKNPEKVFFHVPQSIIDIKKTWFKVARRSDSPSSSNFHCCEDHFDLKEDMENFVRFRLYGGAQKLKAGTLPC
ncbi:hypothetical protein TKK_0016568 [Trichogramma kaykai]